MKFKVNFEVKNANIAKTEKNKEIFLAVFGKSTSHIGLKFCTESFLSRIYNLVFIKIFVGGRLDNNTKNLEKYNNNKNNATEQS